jgi:hypothetical protein
MRDRRAESRHRILKAGKVVLNDCIVDCTVRDISTSGAHLEFEGPVCLPADFQLRFVGADLTIRASAAWQRRLEAGIRFKAATDGEPPRDLAALIAPAT